MGCNIEAIDCTQTQIGLYTFSVTLMKDGALKTYRFHFHASLGDFNLNTGSISCPLTCSWKRSSETTTTSPVDMIKGKASFNQTITLPVNMYFEEAKQRFQQKKTMFTFMMTTPKGEKQAGIVYVQVADMLNKKESRVEKHYTLEKCPVKDSKVWISIEAEMIEEGGTRDNVSVDSSVLQQSDNLSTLSLDSKILPAPAEPQVKPVATKKESTISKESEKSSRQSFEVAALKKQLQKQKKQNESLRKQLQMMASHDEDKQKAAMREEIAKHKQLQSKLERELSNLRAENGEHEKELEKMRVRMEEIYNMLHQHLSTLN